MLVAAGIFVLTLLLFKAPIIISQLGYSLGKKNSPAAAVTTSGAPVSADNTIDIPKINVHAPVVYEPSVDETAIENALQNGVVHYGNTALPGQNGNVAIFGHSSNDWWEPGNYKFVFVLLDKLAPGDTVTVNYNAKAYVYQVTGSTIVDPTDVGVLNPTATPTLSLITCSPPGTSLRRLVVTAKQVSPDPGQATGSATKTSGSGSSGSGNLPSAAPGFLTQLRQAWDSTWHTLRSLVGADSSSSQPSPSASPDSSGQIPAVK
jgi:sortase A